MVKIEDLPKKPAPGTYTILHQTGHRVTSDAPCVWLQLLMDEDGNVGIYSPEAGSGTGEGGELVVD